MTGPLLALALSLSAQPDSPFLRCTGLEDDTARLACFDRTAAIVTQVPQPREGAPVLSPMPQPSAVAAPAPGTAPTAALPPASAAAPAAPSAAPKAASAAERGRFGLPDRRAEDDTLTEAVASLRADPRGDLVVTLESGQVWRQLSSDSVDVRLSRRAGPQTATIRRGAFGSYRMRLEPIGRTIRVRRVE